MRYSFQVSVSVAEIFDSETKQWWQSSDGGPADEKLEHRCTKAGSGSQTNRGANPGSMIRGFVAAKYFPFCAPIQSQEMDMKVLPTRTERQDHYRFTDRK